MKPRLSIPHRYRFGRTLDLRRREDWDELRLSGDTAFALNEDRVAWLQRSREERVVERARALDRLIGSARTIASYGAGTGVNERALYDLDPARRVVLTEFAPRTAERLAGLFPEATVVEHDLLHAGPLRGVDVHIFFRIDTEFDDAHLRAVFARFRSERVVVVATEVLSPRAVAREILTRLRGGSALAGRVRSRGAFEALFAATHDGRAVSVDDLSGWLLEPRASTD